MSIKQLIFLGFLLPFGGLFSQSLPKNEFRAGVGTALLGTGDMHCLTVENEYNRRLNPYFRLGMALQTGNSENGVYLHSNFRQAGVNLQFSPFKNTGNHDLRFGAGLNMYRGYYIYALETMYVNGIIVDEIIKRDHSNSLGVSISVEFSRMITPSLNWGFKVYTNPYLNGDIQSGLLLRGGVLF